jgi:hypothetical protein
MFVRVPLGYIKLIVWTMLHLVARVFRAGTRGLYTGFKNGLSLVGNINIHTVFSCVLVHKAQLIIITYHVNQGL